jgi:hypothetical protein
LLYPDSLRYDLLERTGVAALAAPPAVDFRSRLSGAGAPESNTRYAGKDGKLILLSPDGAGPRIVGRVDIVDTARSSLAAFTDPAFDYKQEVVLERSQLDRLPPVQRSVTGNAEGATVEATQVGVNTLALRGHATTPGWLVIPENWDPGWSAEVNGQPTTVLRGNYTQQVIRVPKGSFSVRLTYEPPGFGSGTVLTLATITGVMLVFVAEPMLRRRRLRSSAVAASRQSESSA